MSLMSLFNNKEKINIEKYLEIHSIILYITYIEYSKSQIHLEAILSRLLSVLMSFPAGCNNLVSEKTAP